MTYETTETGAVFHITNNPSAAPALQRSVSAESAAVTVQDCYAAGAAALAREGFDMAFFLKCAPRPAPGVVPRAPR
jgi:hypothetical protein